MPRPAFRDRPVVRTVVFLWENRLTPRGRYLFTMTAIFALLGADTGARQVYVLFSIGAGFLLLSMLFALRARPRASLACRLPDRATTGTGVRFAAEVRTDERGAALDLFISVPRAREGPLPVAVAPREAFVAALKGRHEVKLELTPSRRGKYVLAGPRLRGTDPLGLMTTAAVTVPDQALLVYPRFYPIEDLAIPLGRRYQPGGIPLSSSTGDAIEFVGTRDYREGDPIRNIHWRSWARRGAPVVKEYQEEYFCRIAIILDTFLPARPKPAERAAFEAAISVVASIADLFSRSEYVVDILAAGPDIYEVSAGRSLAYLENILDVLACLEPCYDPPFQTIGPPLFERLAQLTTVVAVLQDWDPVREAFLRRVRGSGAGVRAIVVHDGPTTSDWQKAGDELGDVLRMTPAEVDSALLASASGAASAPTSAALK
jgi:uncharacterized protein (DUF58 family)